MPSKYFSDKETTCKCGCGQNAMDPMFMRKLDHIRQVLNRPVILNSAFRCPEWNKKEGGKPNSAHLLGMAADIRVSGDTERFEVVKVAVRLNVARIGIANGFVHIDTADQYLPSPKMWLY